MRQPTLLSVLLAAVATLAFTGHFAAQDVQAAPARHSQSGNEPIYRVTVIGRTVTAVNYHVLNGKTSLNLIGTQLLPPAQGHVTVEVKDGATHIHADFDNVGPAQQFGAEYLTYVLWAVTPEGRAANLGEVQVRDQRATVEAATPLQNFAMVVTAEPYFAVSRPGDLVVMENQVKKGTIGDQAEVTAKYDLLQRGQYRLLVDPTEVTAIVEDPKAPLDLFEAQNALRIARWVGAEQYAPDVYRKAKSETEQAEADQAANKDKNIVGTDSRAAIESSEDARLLTANRRLDEEMATAKATAADATADAASAQIAADMSARATASAEAKRQQAEADSADAREGQRAAEVSSAAAQAMAANAEKGQADAQAAQSRAEDQVRDTRAKLLAQLNAVLQTRDTASGLIMNMSDVLFATGQYQLTTEAQVKLAKISGILVAYPDLKLQINGYTDNVGSQEMNQKLSDDRANSVRTFLSAQGVAPATSQANGFGMSDPVASNDDAAGRQQNRRVEMVVSGGVIGTSPDGIPQ